MPQGKFFPHPQQLHPPASAGPLPSGAALGAPQPSVAENHGAALLRRYDAILSDPFLRAEVGRLQVSHLPRGSSRVCGWLHLLGCCREPRLVHDHGIIVQACIGIFFV